MTADSQTKSNTTLTTPTSPPSTLSKVAGEAVTHLDSLEISSPVVSPPQNHKRRGSNAARAGDNHHNTNNNNNNNSTKESRLSYQNLHDQLSLEDQHREDLEALDALFPNNNYPMPVVLPLHLSKLYTPAKTAIRSTILFSTGNNLYFNVSNSTTNQLTDQSSSSSSSSVTAAATAAAACVCTTVLEPNSSDLALVYILRTHFNNAVLTERLRAQHYKCLHSFTICFSGSQAVQLLVQQHSIAQNEREAIGMLTRLLHLSFIIKLETLEQHHINTTTHVRREKASYRSGTSDNDLFNTGGKGVYTSDDGIEIDEEVPYQLQCDHVHPLPVVQNNNNTVYVIIFNLHQFQHRRTLLGNKK